MNREPTIGDERVDLKKEKFSRFLVNMKKNQTYIPQVLFRHHQNYRNHFRMLDRDVAEQILAQFVANVVGKLAFC
jgi:hypothetical protein